MPRATRAFTPDASAARGVARLERARDLLGGEGLEQVAGLDAVHTLHADPALESGQDLAHLVLEPTQRADAARRDHGVAPLHAHAGRAHDLAFLHVRAGNRTELRDVEDLPDLRPPVDRLADLWRQHAGERGAKVVHRL